MKIKYCIVALLGALMLMACHDDDSVVPTDNQIVVDVTGEIDGHNYVDLGLPSGTLWATEDLTVLESGAQSPFFSWGETASKQMFSYMNYRYATAKDSLTKYVCDEKYAANKMTDNIKMLLAYDDAANMNWGGRWFMPSREELEELCDNCTFEYVYDKDSVCYVVGISKRNGKNIVFPTPGAMQQDKLLYANNGVFVWSCELADNNTYAWGLSIQKDMKTQEVTAYIKDGMRILGHSVRPCLPAAATPKAVDLGLPSGTKWADLNLGARAPQCQGYLFAWGETAVKFPYDYTNYAFGKPNAFTKYMAQADNSDHKMVLDKEDDAAIKIWGENWQMPSAEDVEELMEKCEFSPVTISGLKAVCVKGPNGNSIVLPCAGTVWLEKLEYFNQRGFYWCSSLDSTNDIYARGLFVTGKGDAQWGANFNRASGRTIRPVKK